MKSILRVILVLLFLAAAGSTAVGSQQLGGGPIPICDGDICAGN